MFVFFSFSRIVPEFSPRIFVSLSFFYRKFSFGACVRWSGSFPFLLSKFFLNVFNLFSSAWIPQHPVTSGLSVVSTSWSCKDSLEKSDTWCVFVLPFYNPFLPEFTTNVPVKTFYLFECSFTYTAIEQPEMKRSIFSLVSHLINFKFLLTYQTLKLNFILQNVMIW